METKQKHNHKGKTSEKLLDKFKIVNELPLSKGMNVLDAGCGDGYMSVMFAEAVGETGKVYASDIDKNSIEIIKTENKLKNLEPSVQNITTKTTFPDHSMDFIYLSTVIHGFSQAQRQGFISEIKRLLKPNGFLAILEIKKEPMPFGPPQEIRLSPDDLKNLFSFIVLKTVDLNQHFYLQIFKNEDI